MGCLHYDGATSFPFEDRLLTHLRAVILAKFTLQESLVFTWDDAGQQRSIWLHPTMPLHFEFDGDQTPELNPVWVEALLALANTSSGLRCVPEPESD